MITQMLLVFILGNFMQLSGMEGAAQLGELDSSAQVSTDSEKSEALNEKVRDAILAGNVDDLKQRFTEGALSNIRFTIMHEVGGEEKPIAIKGATLFHIAVRSSLNRATIMLELVNRGLSVNSLDDDGGTALHYAARLAGTPQWATVGREALRTLVKIQGINIDLQDGVKRSALHAAAERGSSDAVMILVDAGATVDLKDGNGLIPLHVAAAENRLAAVDVLCNKMATVDQVDSVKRTALRLAIDAFHPEVALRLLKSNANPTIRDEASGEIGARWSSKGIHFIRPTPGFHEQAAELKRNGGVSVKAEKAAGDIKSGGSLLKWFIYGALFGLPVAALAVKSMPELIEGQ
jgi:ankyrin repeat protein